MFHAEHPKRHITARRLTGRALADEYITLDEANQMYTQSITEVLTVVAGRIEAKGGDLPEVLKHWQMLEEVLEYLNETE